MILTLQSTDVIKTGVRFEAARVWRGETGDGVEVVALIVGVGARRADDNTRLERELREIPASPALDEVAQRFLGRKG